MMACLLTSRPTSLCRFIIALVTLSLVHLLSCLLYLRWVTLLHALPCICAQGSGIVSELFGLLMPPPRARRSRWAASLGRQLHCLTPTRARCRPAPAAAGEPHQGG